MGERVSVPIIVGVAGKRDLQGKDAFVRKLLCRAFDDLDVRFPATPKILLTELACGADTLAAEEAHGRDNWSVVAALPISEDLCLQDFDAAGAAYFKMLLARSKKRPLAPLRDPRDPQRRPLEPLALSRLLVGNNPHRTAHYEQAGLFIADYSTLLICVIASDEILAEDTPRSPSGLMAIMPGDALAELSKHARPGGAARIAHYRLTGQLDHVAREVVRRSSELCEPLSFDGPHRGPVWLIDLAAPDAASQHRALSEGQIAKPSMSSARDVEKAVERSLAVIERVDNFNRLVLGLDEQRWRREVVGRAARHASDRIGFVSHVRLGLSAVQGQMNASVRSAVWSLAGLFVLAVVALEIFAEFRIGPGIVIYVGLVMSALSTYLYAKYRRWQSFAEDYRGIGEALRVQLIWWQAGLHGLKHRADRYYLRNLTGSLGLVRDGLRQILNAAMLHAELAPPPAADSHRHWIKHQLAFFKARRMTRLRYVWLVDAISWYLFMGALGSAILLSAATFNEHLATVCRIDSICGKVSLMALLVLVLLFILLVSVLTVSPDSRLEGLNKNPAFPKLWYILPLVGGALFGLELFELAAAVLGRDPDHHVGSQLVILAIVVPTSMAGSARYVSEKLAWEAEAHRYEEALAIFQAAQGELAAIETDPARLAAGEREKRIFSLGKKALQENEAWIRAHRERPLEPVIGG